MTPEAQRIFINEYPYLIPAQSEFYSTTEAQSLSETLNRTTLAAFIPKIGEKVLIFDYGIKSVFERYLKEWLDSTETPDTENILKKIWTDIICEIITATHPDQQNPCTIE